MNKLPRDAQVLLNLTRDAHDPPDEQARRRVQVRLAALALLPPIASSTVSFPPVPPAGAATGASASGWLASSKLLLASVMALSLGGGMVWLGREPARLDQAQSSPPVAQPDSAGAPNTQPTSPEPTPTLAQAEVSALPTARGAAVEPPVAPPARVIAAPRAARRESPRGAGAELAASPATSLREEMALLRRANEQLARGETGAALASIQEHQRRYAHSQLNEEREGLRVLAQCLRGPSAARAQARAYIAHTPASVLVTRVESACDL